MEQLTKINGKSILAFIMLSFINFMVLAQDSTSSSSVSRSSHTVTTTQTWYAEPWVWVVGAVVFIIIIVALTRGGGGGSNSRGTVDRVSVTKKVTREDI